MPVSNLMTESASRTERKRIRNRDALVAAARALFVRDGFEATTIADITSSADLGFGTFYRYFADKEAALEAVLDDGKREIDAVLLTPELDGKSAAEALASLSGRFVVAVRRNRDVLTLMWQVAMRKTVGRRPLSIEALGPEQSLPAVLSSAIARIIDEGITAGEFADGDGALLSRLIAGAHMYLLSPEAHDADEELVIRTLCDFELRALGAEPARPALKPVTEPVRRRAVGGH
jgi:AcrR family transcriptional regulator